MANKNEGYFYQMDFYLCSDLNTDFSEVNDVTFRSKKIDNLAERLKFIRNFRENIHAITISKFENGKCNGLIFASTIKEVEDWFKERGLIL